ncbi:MAG: hypothetical protein ACT4O9_06385 [Blastocatellia bacterium]
MSLRLVTLLSLILLVSGNVLRAQAPDAKERTLGIMRPEPGPTLLDEFGILNSEQRSARFDHLFQEISQNPASTGYVFLYCGKKCRYDEIAAHMRGIEVKIALRQFDRSRVVVRDAGFQESFRTQLWLVPAGSCVPVPNKGLNIKEVVFAKPGKYLMEAYDCCDDYSDVWKNLKP